MSNVYIDEMWYEKQKDIDSDLYTNRLFGKIYGMYGVRDGSIIGPSCPVKLNTDYEFFTTKSGRIWEILDWKDFIKTTAFEELKRSVAVGYRQYIRCGEMYFYEGRKPI